MKEKWLLSYAVCIRDESRDGYVFQSSYLNGADNDHGKNKALLQASEFLDGYDNSRKIGILITHSDNYWSDTAGYYMGSGDTANDYSHINSDMSNWVTAKEAKTAVRNCLKYGQCRKPADPGIER